MTAKTSGDSTQGVSRIIFLGIQDSFTTQEPALTPPGRPEPKASPLRDRFGSKRAATLPDPPR
jgi:hypothetical protein